MRTSAFGKYLIIEKSKKPERSASGLEYSEEETNKIRAHRATVLSVGDEVGGISVGDDVYYDKARSFEQIINGKEQTMTREVDILVIIRPDEEV